jgi:hypothetical protein
MSEMIKKFRPPTIPTHRQEAGVRYVEPPEQKDWLGQTLAVNDIVIYSRGSGYGSALSTAKIIGIYTKVDPRFNRVDTSTTISIAIETSDYRGKRISRQGTTSDKLIKLLPSQYTEKVSDDLLGC